MIRCELYSPRCDWRVHLFFSVNEYWVDEIMDCLFYLGLDGQRAKTAYDNISSGDVNCGLCYSNYDKHESVVVIGKASNASELFNSTMHEFKHLSSHMAKACGLEETGEEIAYATGELAHDMWPLVKHLFCDCCRKKKEYHEREHGDDNGFGVRGRELSYYYE